MDIRGSAEQHVEGVIEVLFRGFQMASVVVLLACLVFLLDGDDQTIDRVSLGLKLFLDFWRRWFFFWSFGAGSCQRWSGRPHGRRRRGALLLSGVFAREK